MEDLPLGRIATLVPEFAVKDLPLAYSCTNKRVYIPTGILKIDAEDKKNLKNIIYSIII